MSSIGSTLVTGATGFVGRRVMAAWPQAVAWPKGRDLTDRDAVNPTVAALLSGKSFERLLHLAAFASLRESFADPVRLYQVNLMGTLHLLQALSDHQWHGRVLFVSSGAVYQTAQDSIDENSKVAPGSPYAASKLAAEQVVLEWGERCQVEVIIARPFNHSGPGQTDHYFLPSVARQIASVPRGGRVTVTVGNLDPRRDFLHVDDVVGAYAALLERGRQGCVYNVASGRSQTLRAMVDRLAALSGRQVDFCVDPGRCRTDTVLPMTISIERIVSQTGWKPARGLDDLLLDLIGFWEAEICGQL